MFNAALKDPDSLASVAEEDSEFEAFALVSFSAYEAKTGRDDFYKRLETGPSSGLIGDLDDWADGADGDPAKLARLYPKLSRKFD